MQQERLGDVSRIIKVSTSIIGFKERNLFSDGLLSYCYKHFEIVYFIFYTKTMAQILEGLLSSIN